MHVVRTLATGGTENIVRRLLTGLDPDRFEQSVCTVVPASGVQGMRTICLGLQPNQPAYLMPRFIRTFYRARPDIVHSRNWATIEAVLAARLTGVSAIVHSEHGRDLETMGAQPLRRRVFRRLSYARADRVFCVSEELREYYCDQLGLPGRAFSVIANGVDVEQFRPSDRARGEMRAKLGAGPSTIVVGTVGRLDPVKDHVTLLRAAEIALSRGVDLQLVIVGEGTQRTTIERALAEKPELAQRTSLLGDVRNVAEWLNALDIFVLSSLSEGMSNTLLEAMAVGVAAIATAVGGNRELIEDGSSGLLVPTGKPDALGNLLVNLAADQRRRRELGNNARARVVSRFSMDRMLKQYDDMYCDLLKQASVRSPAPARA
jgi:sugar transferase (PEP-CTERM/EpsH1 system associated)